MFNLRLMAAFRPLGVKLAHSLSEKETQYTKGASIMWLGVWWETIETSYIITDS